MSVYYPYMAIVLALISILLLLCQPGALSTAPARTPAAATSAPPQLLAPHERRTCPTGPLGSAHQCPSVISVAKPFGLTRAATRRGNPSRSSLFSNSALFGATGGLPTSDLGLRSLTAGPLFSYSAFNPASSGTPASASFHRHAGAHSLANSPGGSLFTYSTSPVRVCHLPPCANSPRSSLFTYSTTPPHNTHL